MRKATIGCVLLGVMLTGPSMAANSVWNPAANGIFPPATGDWGTATNWTQGLPGVGSNFGAKAVFNVPNAAECHVTDLRSDFKVVQGDNDDGGVLRIKSGGTLDTIVSWSAIGYNNPAHLIVETGGTFNFGQHAWIGFTTSSNSVGLGTVDINGGTVTVGQMLGLGWSGGTGFVNVNDGGTLGLFQLHGDGFTSVKNGSLINVTGSGKIVYGPTYGASPANHTGVFESYVANELLVANGVTNDVIITFDTNTLDTIVTAAPIIPDPPLFLTSAAQSGGALDFEWSSVPTRQFDLISSENLAISVDTWPIYNDGVTTYENMPNSATGTNTLTGVLPVGGPPRYFAVRKEFGNGITLFVEDFDAGSGLPSGWTSGTNVADTGTTSWEVGVPSSVGPAAANSPTNCAATGIAANYGANSDIWLRSPDIDLTDTNMASVTLFFEQSRDIEVALDAGSIRVLRAGDLVQLGADVLSPVAGSIADWQLAEIDLPPEAIGETVKIEFQFESDASNGFLWNASFEEPVLAEPNRVDALGEHGWQMGRYGLPGEAWQDQTDVTVGIWNPDSLNGLEFIPDGANVAFVEGKYDFDTGIRQELQINLESNTQYDLTVEVASVFSNGDGTIIPLPSNRVEIVAGGVVVAESPEAATPAFSIWGTLSLNWNSAGDTNNVFGQPLEIRLITVATGTNIAHELELGFDDVNLTVTPAPGSVDLAGWYIDDVKVKTPIP